MKINFNLHQKTFEYQTEISKADYTYFTDQYDVIADLSTKKTKGELNSCFEKLTNDISVENANLIFKGGFFIVIIDKVNMNFISLRDISGIKTGYYFQSNQNFLISSNVHSLAKSAGIKKFNPLAIEMLLSMEFIYDGLTYYEEISEFSMGGGYKFNGKSLSKHITPLGLSQTENELNLSENAEILKDKINNVHYNLAGENNIVYLSGGLDSCVMMASLRDVVDNNKIESISYKVKGTNQDETIYAKKMADSFNLKCKIIEVDPENPNSFAHFEDELLKMNNPYIGMHIFKPIDIFPESTMFAGQDTRLHTPDINQLDNIIFSLLLKNKRIPGGRFFDDTFQKLYFNSNLVSSSNVYLRNLDRIISMTNPEEYLNRFFFKINKNRSEKMGLNTRNINEFKKFFEIDFSQIDNKRALYNSIVDKKWHEQYTDDIRYMDDMGKIAGVRMQLPFYDIDLARFSSTIPYDLSTKFVKGDDQFSNKKARVNKAVLRTAYKDSINEELLNRKKAVSITNYLLFNGWLGNKVTELIKNDISQSDSFIKEFDLKNTVNLYLNKNRFTIADQKFLLRIYTIATLCFYYQNLRS